MAIWISSRLDDREAVRRISAAVLAQAVKDWRWLCRGHDEDCDCVLTFAELEEFFKEEASLYADVLNLSAERIYAQLQKERIQAERRRK